MHAGQGCGLCFMTSSCYITHPRWFVGSVSLRLHNNIVAGKRGGGAIMGKAGGGGVERGGGKGGGKGLL